LEFSLVYNIKLHLKLAVVQERVFEFHTSQYRAKGKMGPFMYFQKEMKTSEDPEIKGKNSFKTPEHWNTRSGRERNFGLYKKE
jgi:hypothetical protein